MTGLLYARCELRRLAQYPSFIVARAAFPALVMLIAASLVDVEVKPQELGGSAAALFVIFFWCQFIVAGILVPALVAPDMPLEREQGTLELLLSCPQKERDLILGKFVSHASTVCWLLAASLPVGVCAVVLGGIAFERALAASFGAILTALFAVALSLRVSLLETGTIRATLKALGLHLGILAVLWIFGNIASEFDAVVFIVLGGFAAGGSAGAWASRRFTGVIQPAWVFAGGTAGVVAALLLIPRSAAPAPIPYYGYGPPPRVKPLVPIYFLCPWHAYIADATASGLTWTQRAAAWSGHLLLIAIAVADLASSRLAARFASASRGFDEEPPFIPRLLGPRAGGGESVATALLAARRAAGAYPAENPGAEAAQPSRPPPRLAFSSQQVREVILKRESRLPVWRFPILWRDSVFVHAGSLKIIVWMAAVVSVILLLRSFFSDDSSSAYYYSYYGSGGYSWSPSIVARWNGAHDGLHFQIVMLATLLAVTGASTIAPERQKDTIGVLLATGIPVRRVLEEKFMALGLVLAPVLAATALHLALVAGDLGVAGKGIAFVFVMTAITVATLSVACSALATRLRMALPLAFLVPLGLYAVPELLVLGEQPWARNLRDCQPISLISGLIQLGRYGDAVGSGPQPTGFLAFALGSSAVSVASIALSWWALDRGPKR
ncbi:MAG: ABC transporter [Planctomycetota bacterium]|nr:MAG: ABC transporter [Planctomycetota bacterium]